ncbi:MAG TPA: acyl-CoA dehydrogenase family protein [Steroidobacteraceae bacterium]|nr:acyl-CoA dehydrogenase family protein [Steroidobacteraceae bacterium]
MDLNFSASEERFRAEVRAFVAAQLPAALRDKVLGHKRLEREDFLTWVRILNTRGWVAPAWPRRFGGQELDPARQLILEEECALAGAPPVLPFGPRMVAPVIMAFGNEAQQEYYLPRILRGEHWWCQGYSEPGAGSDLASLKTRAERRGESYVVSGQKTWTTLAQYADWIFCLVRTAQEGRPQEGISFLLIDMKSPGVTVRPIAMLDGEHEINEVWFDNVEVPVANRVGKENEGWTYAKFLLGHERVSNAALGVSKRALRELKAIAAAAPTGSGRPLIEVPHFRERIAEVEIDLMALEVMVLRVIAMDRERHTPGPEASLLKLHGSQIQQTISELSMEALGPYAPLHQPLALSADWAGSPAGPPLGPGVTGRYFNYRKTSIYAGSNEIQRNIIARHMLGL